MTIKIVSGGQTGADRAALDVAIKLDIPHGGWCPRGRAAEDGIIPTVYNLQEPDSKPVESISIYDERTKLNIKDSDATIILLPVIPIPKSITDGTNLTISEVKAQKKPFLLIDLSKPNVESVQEWISKNQIKVLNIAGPRQSQSPGIYQLSFSFLETLMLALVPKYKNTLRAKL